MLITPHTLVAAALVKLFPHPAIAIPTAVFSHFLLDFFVLHWNPHIYTEFKKKGAISRNSMMVIWIDAFLAISFCFLILFRFWPDWSTIGLYGAGIFFGTLPDTVEIPYFFFGYKGKLLKAYVDFEHTNQKNGSFFWGMLTQIITVAVSLFIFFN